jgi:hypothetical protein
VAQGIGPELKPNAIKRKNKDREGYFSNFNSSKSNSKIISLLFQKLFKIIKKYLIIGQWPLKYKIILSYKKGKTFIKKNENIHVST